MRSPRFGSRNGELNYSKIEEEAKYQPDVRVLVALHTIKDIYLGEEITLDILDKRIAGAVVEFRKRFP